MVHTTDKVLKDFSLCTQLQDLYVSGNIGGSGLLHIRRRCLWLKINLTIAKHESKEEEEEVERNMEEVDFGDFGDFGDMGCVTCVVCRAGF